MLFAACSVKQLVLERHIILRRQPYASTLAPTSPTLERWIKYLPTQAFMILTSALLCFANAFTTGVPGGVNGALSM